jgi:hypothetical protein
MSEEPRSERRKWLVGTTLTVVTVLIGLLQFSMTYAVSVRQPFEIQTKQCVSASENAARLASTRNMDTWKDAREQFWMLYWGPLAIVENVGAQEGQGRVESLMVAFGNVLREVEKGTPTLPVSQLEQKALAISHACRDLLISRWNAGLFSWVSQWFGQ